MQIKYRYFSAERHFVKERDSAAESLLNEITMVLSHRDDEIHPFNHLLRQLPLDMRGGVSAFENKPVADDGMNRLGFGLDAG